MMKKRLTYGAVAVIATAVLAAPSMADLSANIGFASEYYYRGILQKDSSASAGVDYEAGGFYLGSWAADVGDGLEVDVYGGYNLDLGEFTIGAGATGYYYTGDFDETYEEINLNASWSFLSVGYSIGEWDGDSGQDYDFLQVTAEHNGFYGTYGSFGKDFDGDYFELGYGTEVSGIDLGIAAIFNSKELSDQDGSGEALIFTIGKTFDLM